MLEWNPTQKPCYSNESELATSAGAGGFQQQLIGAWWTMWRELIVSCSLQFYSRAVAKKYANLEIVKTLFLKDDVACTAIIAHNNWHARSTQFLAEDNLEVGAQRLLLILSVAKQNNKESAWVGQYIGVRSELGLKT